MDGRFDRLQGPVNHAVDFQEFLAPETFRYDGDAVMPALRGAGMSGMLVTFVYDFEIIWLKSYI